MGILMSFKSRYRMPRTSPSLLAQLAMLNPPEIVHMVAVGLSVSPSEVAELLASLLDPQQLGALRASLSAEAVSA